MKTVTNATPAQSPLMLADEIATCLGIGRTTAYRWLNAGKIPKVQISPKVFGAYRADILAFLDSRKPPTIPPNDKSP